MTTLNPALARKNRQLNRQVVINTRRFNALMRDIRNDVSRVTENSRDLDTWIERLGGYVGQNAFTTGAASKEASAIVERIAQSARYSTLPKGGMQELVKGVISENTMHYVTRMGDDMKTQLRQIALEGYNQKLAPRDLAKLMSERVDGLNRTRAQVIARTETRRAGNLANYANARLNLGAQSFIVISDQGTVCDYCAELYQNGAIVFDITQNDVIPPIHPHCNCTPMYSTKVQDDRPEENFDTSFLQENGTKDLMTPLMQQAGII